MHVYPTLVTGITFCENFLRIALYSPHTFTLGARWINHQTTIAFSPTVSFRPLSLIKTR